MHTKQRSYFIFLVPVSFIVIYYQAFSADYAYLDEIHQLWHNDDRSNYYMFLTQGRWLTGILVNKFFGSISSVEQLKYLRVFSLAGWIGTAILWAVVFRSWLKWLQYDPRLAWVSDFFVVCSISVAIYIGWASCLEVFLAVGFGLLSGHLLFKQMIRLTDGGKLNFIVLAGSLLLGIASLFIYQSGFGIFLLPFFLYYVQRRIAKPAKMIERGVLFYLMIYCVYYFLFKYSLQLSDSVASNRTEIHFSLAKKFSFFFSGPLPSAFSLNILYRGGIIFCQIWYYLVLLFWVFSVFKRNQEKAIISKITFILIVFILLALIYLPSMVATENFASYRSLFPFNLAVFIMLIESIFSFIRTERLKNVFIISVVTFLLVIGFYDFNIQYINPLKIEYKAVRNYLENKYRPSLQHVHFVRADGRLFNKTLSVNSYRDEFGAPSTSRDWVPEPFVKQIIYEKTGDKTQANRIQVFQYENFDSLQQKNIRLDSSKLLVDVNTLIQ